MTGEAHWLDAVLMLGGGALIVLYLRHAVGKISTVSRERRRFVCPVLRENVKATLTEDLRTDQWLDVKRCSAWRQHGRCDKRCLAPLNRGTVRLTAV
jgi:hypothetical protein